MIIIEDDLLLFNHRLVNLFVNIANESIFRHGRFDVALCGGNTPRAFHKKLAQNPYDKEKFWQKTHVFWVDERCVDWNSPASNYGNAKKDFIDVVMIPTDQVHPMNGSIPPGQGAKDYQNELSSGMYVPTDHTPKFDLVLLGVGEDGHVASLFPGYYESVEKLWVVAVNGGVPDVHRLTLTYPVLNHSRDIIFMVSGKSKAQIVHEIFNQPELNLPAQRIRPVNGNITWVLDQDAASLLS